MYVVRCVDITSPVTGFEAGDSATSSSVHWGTTNAEYIHNVLKYMVFQGYTVPFLNIEVQPNHIPKGYVNRRRTELWNYHLPAVCFTHRARVSVVAESVSVVIGVQECLSIRI